MICGKLWHDSRGEFLPNESVKPDQEYGERHDDEGGEDHIGRPVRSGHDAGKSDKSGGKIEPRAARPIKDGEDGGEAKHVRGVARWKRTSGFRCPGNFGGLDAERVVDGEESGLDRGEADGPGFGNYFDGAGTAEYAFEGVDEESFDQCDGEEQAHHHGTGAETAAPKDEQAGQNHERQPEVEARKDGHGPVEPRHAAIGIEKKKQALVERGRHVC